MGTDVLPGELRSGPERSLTMGATATRPRSAATPSSAVRAHPHSAPATFSTTCSSNLFKQIKSILLFHLTFI